MTFIYRYILFVILFSLGISLQAQIFISTEAELRAISKSLNEHYVLTNDIVINGDWTPLGENSPFQGIFDGNGHAIFNLRINNSNFENVGFFARTYNAQIRNVGFENTQVVANSGLESVNAGIIVGEAVSTSVSDSYTNGGFVQSCGSAGALIGKAAQGNIPTRISNSYAASNVIAVQLNAGGLVGNAENVIVENAYYSGLAQAKYACGGIIGSSAGNNSVFSSAVISESVKGLIVNRIVGEVKSGTLTLNNNYARGDMQIGYRNLYTVPVGQSIIKGIQGESIPYDKPEYVSSYPNYTEADITTATAAFNSAYYSRSKKLYYEYSTGIGKISAIWTQAIFFDIMMNVYLRTRNANDYAMINYLLEGNAAQYDHYNWDNGAVWFIYDDIMWWVISLARSYEVTGDVKYLDLAKSGFERVWSGSDVLKDNGSYDPVNGGMFWAWDQQHPEGTPLSTMGKMACINYPTVIGAMTLFNITKDSTYFKKGLEIFNWAQNNLFDKKTGRVADSKHGTGSPDWKDHVYNQATCIGAATMLYKATGNRTFLDDAVLAANYTKNQMSTNGYLHFETGIEQGIYHAILSQYIIRLIKDGNQYQYIPWLQYNINAGWANRLKASNITYKDYVNSAPDISSIQSYDASGIPALMQVISPAQKEENQVSFLNRTFYEKNLNWSFDTWILSGPGTLPKLKIFTITSGLKKKPSIIR